jgi:hypothetical protein
LLRDFTLNLPSTDEEPVWELGTRFFESKGKGIERRAAVSFAWEATMRVSGGDVIDEWR